MNLSYALSTRSSLLALIGIENRETGVVLDSNSIARTSPLAGSDPFKASNTSSYFVISENPVTHDVHHP